MLLCRLKKLREGSIIENFINVKLIFPNRSHEHEALAYKREFIDNGEKHIPGGGGLYQSEDYYDWLRKISNASKTPPPGWVKSSTYFAFDGEKIVGTIQIRHELNESLLTIGGHIGYAVRPSERRRGCATEMLSLALAECRALGIKKALVTCDAGNAGSARTIIKNGGVLENEFIEPDGNIVSRYWIETAEGGQR